MEINPSWYNKKGFWSSKSDAFCPVSNLALSRSSWARPHKDVWWLKIWRVLVWWNALYVVFGCWSFGLSSKGAQDWTYTWGQDSEGSTSSSTQNPEKQRFWSFKPGFLGWKPLFFMVQRLLLVLGKLPPTSAPDVGWLRQQRQLVQPPRVRVELGRPLCQKEEVSNGFRAFTFNFFVFRCSLFSTPILRKNKHVNNRSLSGLARQSNWDRTRAWVPRGVSWRRRSRRPASMTPRRLRRGGQASGKQSGKRSWRSWGFLRRFLVVCLFPCNYSRPKEN